MWVGVERESHEESIEEVWAKMADFYQPLQQVVQGRRVHLEMEREGREGGWEGERGRVMEREGGRKC